MRYIVRTVPNLDRNIETIRQGIPTLEVVYDNDRNAFHTFNRALELANGEPSVHLEDDIVLTNNFLEKIEKAIAEHPDNLIQFFSMRKDDKTIGSRWDRKFSMNQCFYLPKGYTSLLLEYYKTWGRKEEHPTGYDIMMDDFLHSRKEAYWLYVPSLVQHVEQKSLINPRRSSKRQSKTFVL